VFSGLSLFCRETQPHYFGVFEMPKGEKTKRVNGVDCNSRCFAYVGNPDDTSSWHLCVHVLGDTEKTINAVKNALGRFDQTKGIPEDQRETVRLLCIGAAIAHGVRVDRSILTKTVETPARTAETTPTVQPAPKPAQVIVKRKKEDRALEAAIALADRRATELLRSLGLE
jgi:hypothetical protein